MAKKTMTTFKSQLMNRISDDVDYFWGQEWKDVAKRPFRIPFFITLFLLIVSNFLWVVF